MSSLPDTLRVGVDSIDTRHEEFYELYEALKNSPFAEFIPRFEALIDHSRTHFSEEEANMAHLDYYNLNEHKDEHGKALEEMEYFLQKAKKGKSVFAQAYVRERLGEWFRNHLYNMDSDLARVIKYQNEIASKR